MKLCVAFAPERKNEIGEKLVHSKAMAQKKAAKRAATPGEEAQAGRSPAASLTLPDAHVPAWSSVVWLGLVLSFAILLQNAYALGPEAHIGRFALPL